MGYQPKQMIAFGIGRPFHPYLVQEPDSFPRQGKRRLERIEASFKLMPKEWVIENALSKRGATLRIRQRIRHCALRERNADHAVCNAREVQNFQNQIDS